jgi:hypothetical protein
MVRNFVTNCWRNCEQAMRSPSGYAGETPRPHPGGAGFTQKKVTLLAGLRLPEMESLYADICEYVKFVEEGIGNDPKQTAPWLFDDFGFTEAKNETI